MTERKTFLQNPGRKHPIHQSQALPTLPHTPAKVENEECALLSEGAFYALDKEAGHSLLEEDDLLKPVRGEIALWRAVITQAMTDALSQSNKPEMFYEKTQATAWLEGRMADFFTVCEYACVEPSDIRIKAKKALKKQRLPLSRKPHPKEHVLNGGIEA